MSDSSETKYVTGYSPKDVQIRVVKSFLDILILVEMKKQNNLSGYDITGFVNEKFGGILSPGTVYATLYAMQRKGLLKSENDGRKTTYTLTEDGNLVISSILNNFDQQVGTFLKKFLLR